MVTLALALTLTQSGIHDRTPSVYRCPTAEAEGPRFERLVVEHHFTEICVEPKPGPKAREIVGRYPGKVRFVDARTLDTKANLAWRNETIDFILGKVSPRVWLDRTKNLKTSAHFLTTPKTADLRTVTNKSILQSVFAELLVVCWPGKPCFTSTDIWKTRFHPDDDQHLSWILSMNDWLGPMLQSRVNFPVLVTGRPKIIRADKTPGLLVFSQSSSNGKLTFYLNNGEKPIQLPGINADRITISRHVNFDKPRLELNAFGFLVVDEISVL